ncbi:hypothetical protein QTP88_023515 [Uroleucon formosanum]
MEQKIWDELRLVLFDKILCIFILSAYKYNNGHSASTNILRLNLTRSSGNNAGMWNCHKRRHRTNNIVEGWNSKLNKILDTLRPTFKNLFTCLKKDAENSELLYTRSYLNMEGKRKRIKKTLVVYEIDNDLVKCLKKIAFIQKLE